MTVFYLFCSILNSMNALNKFLKINCEDINVLWYGMIFTKSNEKNKNNYFINVRPDLKMEEAYINN